VLILPSSASRLVSCPAASGLGLSLESDWLLVGRREERLTRALSRGCVG